MKTQDFNTSITVDQTPDEAVTAILNIRGWWCENILGNTDKLGEEFDYFDEGLACRMKLTELIPGKKVVWSVLESQMNNFEGGKEWNGTSLVFAITKGEKTKVEFTHLGLVPEFDCYNVCSKAWSYYIKKSLFGLISTGQGDPIKKVRVRIKG